MLKRIKLIQAPDELKQAGKLAMMIFGQGDVKSEDYSGSQRAVAEILSLNTVPWVYLYNYSNHSPSSIFGSEIVAPRLQTEQKRYNLWKEGFGKVKDIFLRNSVDYLFIKTPSFFPYTCGNLDVLVKEEDFARAGALLEKDGFIELKNIREPHKYLFKRFDLGEEVVPIHLHSRVFWGSTFIDPKSAWSNAPRRLHDDIVFTLSAEDCLLTTLAHSFYENSAIKLLDLCIVKYIVENNKLDWRYLVSVTEQNNWKDGFSIAFLIYNHLHHEIFNSQLFPQDLLKEMELYTSKIAIMGKALQRLLKTKTTMPFYLPLLPYKTLIFGKVLRTQEFGGYFQRIQILFKDLFLTLLIHILKVNIQTPMLVSFSGIDGSGKSSYAHQLQKAFESCGLKTSYIWTRVGSLKGFQSLKKLWFRRKVKLGSSVSPHDPDKFFSQMQAQLGRSWRGSLWRLVNIVDFCIFYNFKVRTALLRRRVVICDRYVPDVLADLYVHSTGKKMFWSKFLYMCLPYPRLSLLLNITPEAALERTRDKESLKFLSRQAELYNQMLNSLDFKVVDTLDNFPDTCNRIIYEVLKTYYKKSYVWLETK